MAVFVWIPTYGSSVTIQPEVLVIPPDQYGSDRERRIQIGAQHQRRVWSLTFANRANATADAIEAFLRARGGVESFDWVPTHGTAGKWVCGGFTTTPTSPSHRSIEATFREVFGE